MEKKIATEKYKYVMYLCKLWISECGGYTCDNERKNNGIFWFVCYRSVNYHSTK